MNKLIIFSLIIIAYSCSQNPTEKHQGKRDHIVDVHDKVKGIDLGDDIMLSKFWNAHIIDDCLLISDVKSINCQIRIFNKNTFAYLSCTAPLGQGPGEITNMGRIGINEKDREFYVSDHGKQRIFSYNLDSILTNPNYMPKAKMTMNEREFPSDYQYVNDTLSVGIIIRPTGNYGFNALVAKWNMNTGEITPMPYNHPQIEKKRISLAVSVSQNKYVECHSYHDLMTICSLNGELNYNIYGRYWDGGESQDYGYYQDVIFCKEKILALYTEKKEREKNNYPSQILVFDINGEYLKTLELGLQTSSLCYDEENNRLLLSMQEEIQFGYLDLNGLID